MLERLLNQTLRTSIARRWLVVVAALLITLWGLAILSRMPLDVFPQFAPPQVDVQTSADGLAPEEVEQRFTVPIESAVNGLPGVETVRSSSKVGLSMVQVVFDQNADINRARQSVAERLQQIEAELPANASAPAISPLVSPLGTILQYAFTLKGGGPTTPMALRRIVATTFNNQILEVPGVSQVTLYGGEEAQQQIQIDPQRLQARQVSLQGVAEAAAAASANAPGGFLIAGGQEKLIRASGQALSSADLADSVVTNSQGQTLRLGDVAEVRLASALKRGDGSFNGKPAVVLMINKQPDIDTPRVTREVEARIAALSKTLPADIEVTRTFRQANFIDTAIKNVSASLIEGILIVSVVMVLFLMNWRTAVITLSAIPLSLVIGLMLMRAFGLEINTMTLGGLVVAIGSVVDDAIVDMENCYSGLRRNQVAAQPRNPLQVVFETSVEVRQPVLLSSVIIVVVFAPIFSLTGVEGRIFAPMGLAYLFSIAASSLVALTLTPALCAILLANTRLPAENTWVATWAERAYKPLLEFSLLSPKRVLAAALAFVVVACAILPSLGRVFLPEFREKSLVNSMVLYPGVSLEMTNRAGLALSKTLKASPLFEWVQVRTGRAPGDADGAGVNLAHVDVELSDAAMKNRPAAIAELRNAFLKLPGVAPNIGGFISHRMDEVLSGVRSAIAVKIYGPDLRELRRIGEQVRDAIEPIQGVVDLQLEPQLPIQQVQIAFDRKAATANGLTMQQLADAVEIALNGKTVGQVVSGGTERTDVVVLLPEVSRNSLDALRALPIATPAGTMLPLGSLARIDYGLGANVVNREDVSRLIVVSTNVSGRPLGRVVADIQNTIDSKIKLPSGYLIRYGGQFESEERATTNLLLYSLLAMVVIAVLMFVAVKSLPATIAILINLPLALAFGAGNEILQPLAIVVLGGLITSTLLTLLVLPALYARFGRWLLPRATAES